MPGNSMAMSSTKIGASGAFIFLVSVLCIGYPLISPPFNKSPLLNFAALVARIELLTCFYLQVLPCHNSQLSGEIYSHYYLISKLSLLQYAVVRAKVLVNLYETFLVVFSYSLSIAFKILMKLNTNVRFIFKCVLRALHDTKYGQIFNKNIIIRHPREGGDPSKWLIKMDSRFRGNDGIVSF